LTLLLRRLLCERRLMLRLREVRLQLRELLRELLMKLLRLR
jgi:hypothetical protein